MAGLSVPFVQTQEWLEASWALVPRTAASSLGLVCTDRLRCCLEPGSGEARETRVQAGMIPADFARLLFLLLPPGPYFTSGELE